MARRRKPSRSAYRYEQLMPQWRRQLDPRSVRTKTLSGGKLLRIGCPRGHWHPQNQRCDQGTRAISILRPRVANPELIVVNPAPRCPACGTGEGMLLGYLGNLAHYRCRDCGITFSKTRKVRPRVQPWDRRRGGRAMYNPCHLRRRRYNPGIQDVVDPGLATISPGPTAPDWLGHGIGGPSGPVMRRRCRPCPGAKRRRRAHVFVKSGGRRFSYAQWMSRHLKCHRGKSIKVAFKKAVAGWKRKTKYRGGKRVRR